MKSDSDSLYYFERLQKLPDGNGMYTAGVFKVGVLGKVHENIPYDNLPVARSFARRESEINSDKLVVIAVLDKGEVDEEDGYAIFQAFVNGKEVKL